MSEGMGLSSYESIVTLHPAGSPDSHASLAEALFGRVASPVSAELHSGLCMQTCDRSSPCWKRAQNGQCPLTSRLGTGGRLEGAMPLDEFEEILEEAFPRQIWLCVRGTWF